MTTVNVKKGTRRALSQDDSKAKPKRYFTPLIDKFFAAWILPSTWYTGNPHDEERFFHFVHALHRYSRPQRIAGAEPSGEDVELPRRLRTDYRRNLRTYDEGALREKMIEAAERNHGFDKATAESYVRPLAKEARLILDFLHVIEKPNLDPRAIDIAKWNPPLK